MSIACKRSSLQQECHPSIPAEETLTGDETLEFFVEKIRLRENSRSKRALLPDLAPCSEDEVRQKNIWHRATHAVSILRGHQQRGRSAYVTVFEAGRG